MGNLHNYAESELRAAGLMDEDGGMYGDLLGKSTLELIDVFAAQGHSGMSASIASDLFNRLSRFEPLTPLTGEDSEWESMFDGAFQNKRCSRVFKDADGRAYDIEGRVFREASGCCFTNLQSHVTIEFPYTPKREYVDVPGSAEE